MKSDILIIGGGVIGFLTALAIRKTTPLSVTLLTDNQKENASIRRVSAITKKSQRFLQSLNVWQRLGEENISPFEKIFVTEENHPTTLNLLASELGIDALGYIIANKVIVDAVATALAQDEYFTFYETNVTDLKMNENEVEIFINDKVLSAKLLIGADGVNSIVRSTLGIPCKRHDYQMKGIVASVRTKLSHQMTARQVYLSSGPLAFLPLTDAHTASIVWSLPMHKADELMSLSDEEFNEALFKAYSALGEVSLIDKRLSFPLIKQEALHYIAERTLLIGDAAHVVHPLAGLGLNFGISDVMILQTIVQSHIENFASYPILRKYERKAKAENYYQMKIIDVIYEMFVHYETPCKRVRRLGASLVESSSFLKRQIMRFATW